MPGNELYDNLAETYDLMIDWKSRLHREKPFWRSVFKQYRARRILDTACGTGMHVIAFHDWGYHVTGTDINTSMVEKSKANAGSRPIEFINAGFTELQKTGGLFDAVTCLGNSLPHILTDEDLDKALSSMYDVLLPGGILVIHSNNYDKILSLQERFMPLAHTRHKRMDYLFIRFFDFQERLLNFNVVTLVKNRGNWKMRSYSSKHQPHTKDLLEKHLIKAGFAGIRYMGGFPDEPFVKTKSDNLIVIAQKPHNSTSKPRSEPIKLLDKIPIHENGDPLVDVEASAPELFVRDENTLLRKTVVDILRKASELLPDEYKLKIKAGLRHISIQKEMYEHYSAMLREEHPSWPKSRINREMNKYLAPTDAKHPPGHATGGAVDVTLIDSNGEDIAMEESIEAENTHWQIFPMYSRYITPRSAKNRQILYDAMISAGFSCYPGEWWHYSYGDSGWAFRMGADFALYDAVDGLKENN